MQFDDILCRVVRSPLWVPDVQRWRWRTHARQWQGPWPGDIDAARPGLINLLWLALDTDEPPQSPFDARTNPLYKWVAWQASTVRVGTVTLEVLAETTPLANFAITASTLPATTEIGRLGRIAQRKVQLANAR